MSAHSTLKRKFKAPDIQPVEHTVVGKLVALSSVGEPEVTFAGALEPIKARFITSALPLTIGDTVLVAFEDGDASRPLIVGRVNERLTLPAYAPREARIDGERVVLEAQQEVVLRCGQASITLRADGKIVIKGAEVVSRASGAHKIKGALVNIN